MPSNSGQGNSLVNATLQDDGTPINITGAYTIPNNLRSFSLVVLQGPVTINGIANIPTGFTLSRTAEQWEVLDGFTINATGGRVVLDTLRR